MPVHRPLLSVKGGTLTAHFAHQDPLETCLAWRVQQGLEPDLVAAEDLANRLASRVGGEHEQTVVAGLRRRRDGVTVIGAQPDDPDRRRQIALTMDAMRRGDRMISGGFLRMEGRIPAIAEAVRATWSLPATPLYWGEPDLLRRVDDADRPSRFGAWHYEVADIKSARRATVAARLQVAFYSWLLTEIQGVAPIHGHVVPRQADGRPAAWDPFLIADALPIAELFVRETYWSIVTADPAGLDSPSGFTTPLAQAWAEREGLVVDPLPACHLAAQPGMRRPARRVLERASVRTITDLAAASDRTVAGAAGPGVTTEGLRHLREQARTIVAGRPRWRAEGISMAEAARSLVGGDARSGPGIADPLAPGTPILHLDLESDPFSGIEYLFGMQVVAGRSRPAPQLVWAETPDAAGEAAAFRACLKSLEAACATHPGLVIVHYGAYEPSRLRMLAGRHPDGGTAGRVEALCDRMLDLYRLISTTLWLPLPSYSIKAVAPALAAWDPPGHGHAWLAIPTIAACHDRLRAEGHGARAAKAAVDDLRAAATDLDLADEAELLAPSAAMSIVWHDRWRQTESPVWRQLIGWYNQDDLRASDAVFRWLAAIAQDNPGIDAAGTPPRRSGSARRTTR